MSRKAVIFCCILEGDSSEIFGISSIRLIGVYIRFSQFRKKRIARRKISMILICAMARSWIN